MIPARLWCSVRSAVDDQIPMVLMATNNMRQVQTRKLINKSYCVTVFVIWLLSLSKACSAAVANFQAACILLEPIEFRAEPPKALLMQKPSSVLWSYIAFLSLPMPSVGVQVPVIFRATKPLTQRQAKKLLLDPPALGVLHFSHGDVCPQRILDWSIITCCVWVSRCPSSSEPPSP